MIFADFTVQDMWYTEFSHTEHLKNTIKLGMRDVFDIENFYIFSLELGTKLVKGITRA